MVDTKIHIYTHTDRYEDTDIKLDVFMHTQLYAFVVKNNLNFTPKKITLVYRGIFTLPCDHVCHSLFILFIYCFLHFIVYHFPSLSFVFMNAITHTHSQRH